MSVTLEVLHVPGCPHLPPLLQRLRQISDLPVTTREITSDQQATEAGMHGSPTLLVNGRDPFSTPDAACGLACRIYRDDQHRAVPVPSIAQLRAAVAANRDAPASGATPDIETPPSKSLISKSLTSESRPSESLAGWRGRAQPTDPVEHAVHQAILRTFATTGRPPIPADLDPVTAGSGRATTSALTALHDLDAIRLAPDGQIAAAYPFSATSTRHRVHITHHNGHHFGHGSGRVAVYAMCAIDALGIAAMLGADTGICSTDPTNGRPVRVTTTSGTTRWEPAEAIVFLGADPCGGASADCCCDYLNFFTDHPAANAWALAHPHIPGHVLTQTEAETLGTRLFGHLLTTT